MLVPQSCLTPCDLIYSPLGSSVHLLWDSPGKNTRGDRHSLLQGIFPTQGSNPGLLNCRLILYHLSHQEIFGKSESHSVVSDSLQHHATPWTIQSMEFSRPEYCSGFPSPGDIPNPGIEPRSPTLQVDSLPAEPQGKPKNTGMGSLSLLQQVFLTQESNQGLLHCRRILYQLSNQGSHLQENEHLVLSSYIK